jgi:hypothetical protein
VGRRKRFHLARRLPPGAATREVYVGLKPRRSFEVTVHGAMPQDAVLTILVEKNDGFGLYADLGERPGYLTLLATCDSAKRLSDYAFDNGAMSVRHDYDLRLSDGEA